MYLDLMDALRAPGAVVQREISIPAEELDEAGVVSPVRGIVKAQNGRRHIVVSGVASTEVEMECGRCLRLFAQPMQVELEAVAPISLFAEAVGHAHAVEEDENENDELDDELAAIFHGHTADVTELVRQAIELNRPIKPLCSPDCPGLPEAQTYVEESDPRWDALRRLKAQAEINADGNGQGS